MSIIEPVSSKSYKLTCALIEDSNQSSHLHSLTRVFASCSMGSKETNVCPGGNINSDQTRMHRLICIFTASTCQLVPYAGYGLN